jgi:hypothetical protein
MLVLVKDRIEMGSQVWEPTPGKDLVVDGGVFGFHLRDLINAKVVEPVEGVAASTAPEKTDDV